jgi:hypothetical protein
MRPVRTRSPRVGLLLALLLLGGYAAVPLLFFLHLRPDLREQPAGWLWGVSFAWFLGMLAPLSAALLPRRGQVLPDGARALVVAGAALLLLTALSLLFPAPPSSRSSRIPGLLGHCLQLGMGLAVAPIAGLLLAIRRLAPVGSWRLGAALGAAGGALSGTLLHWTCSVVSRWHVAAAHAGAVLLCALFGAVVTHAVAKR